MLRVPVAIAGLFLAIISSLANSQAQISNLPTVLPVRDSSEIRFAHVISAEGQPHSRVGSVTQDDFGFLWLTTQGNLQRYDGYRFKEYRHDPGNPNTPAGARNLIMSRAASGGLWIGADQSLDLYDPASETFTHYRSEKGQSLFDGQLFDIEEDRERRIWLSTDDGLVQLDPISGRTVHYRRREGDPDSLSSNNVRATFEDAQGTFWVGTAEGIDVLDRKAGKVIQHFSIAHGFARSGPLNPYLFMSFCQDHAGVIWVAFSYGYGLARIDRGAHKLEFYSLDGAANRDDLHSGVRAILEDEDGGLWLGTTANGLMQMDRERTRLVRYRNNSSDPDSLSSDQVNSIFEDREGNIWVGTTGGWLNKFPRRRSPFRRYRHEAGNPNSLDSNYTSAIFQDSTGALWVGSMKALTRIDRKTGRYTFYRKGGGAGSLSSTWIVSIAEDKSGDLWFGTIGGGLNRLDRKTGRFTAYRHLDGDPHSLSHDAVLSVFVDDSGTVWAGTEDGLDRFNREQQNFQVFRLGPAHENQYRAIAEDFNGGLWLGTSSSGLHYLNPASGKSAVYRHGVGAKSLSSDDVRSVCIDYGGSVWIATGNGLNRFDPSTRTFVVFDEHDGLSNNDVSSVVQDLHGDLWMGTNNGLSRLNARTKTFRNYSVADGLVGNEFYNYASAYKGADGELFFNNYAGVVSFFPDDVVDNPYVPPVVLTDFQLSSKSVSVGGTSPLQRSIAITKFIQLAHEQSIFSLEFSALSYANPERNRYRYRLEGLESDWIETDSSRRFVTYTTLPPGDYVFRAQGSNNRGIWNETGVALHILVLPAWWSTWWFRTALLLFIIAMMWIAYYVRIRSVNRRNRELMLLNRELQRSQHELQESESKLADAQRIAHVGHWDLDVRTRIAVFSEEACRIYGFDPKVNTLSFDEVEEKIPPEQRPAIEAAIQRGAEGAAFCEFEHSIIRADGEIRRVQAHGHISKDARGSISHIFGTIQDITERSRAEEEIRRLNAELEERVAQRTGELTAANKELEAFASSVSHDLRAPLRHIAAFSNILLDEYAEQVPEEAQHFLDRIAKQTQRMGQLVDDLLNLSRLGRQELRFHPVQLDEVVLNVLQDLTPECKDRTMDWRIGRLPTVEGDSVLLTQVFHNLLANAVKFTRPRATSVIEIGETQSGGQRVIFVKDNGVGFDMRFVDKLFGVFQRLHRAEEFEGTGVGLATVQRIVQRHGGRIWAESVVGQGATFYLSLGNNGALKGENAGNRENADAQRSGQNT